MRAFRAQQVRIWYEARPGRLCLCGVPIGITWPTQGLAPSGPAALRDAFRDRSVDPGRTQGFESTDANAKPKRAPAELRPWPFWFGVPTGMTRGFCVPRPCRATRVRGLCWSNPGRLRETEVSWASGRWGRKTWWSQPGSNRRPPACHAGALPAELWPLAEARYSSARSAGGQARTTASTRRRR